MLKFRYHWILYWHYFFMSLGDGLLALDLDPLPQPQSLLHWHGMLSTGQEGHAPLLGIWEWEEERLLLRWKNEVLCIGNESNSSEAVVGVIRWVLCSFSHRLAAKGSYLFKCADVDQSSCSEIGHRCRQSQKIHQLTNITLFSDYWWWDVSSDVGQSLTAWKRSFTYTPRTTLAKFLLHALTDDWSD